MAQAYDRLVIRDLGSRNGIRVNGLVVEEACLNPGDEVAIGPLIYRLEDVAAPPAPTPTPAPAAPASASPPLILPDLPVDTGDADDDLIPLIDL